MRSVGYRQAWRFLDGQGTFDDFRQEAIAATRQLVKRQMTWLRSMPDVIVIEPTATATLSALKLL
jgi:tRNA dimethylallyltransferase